MNGHAMSGWLKVMMAVTIIGAINWGLVGFANWNLVTALFGGDIHAAASTASRVIYGIVGVCGVAGLLLFPWTASARTPTQIQKPQRTAA